MKILLTSMALVAYVFASPGSAHVRINNHVPMYSLPGKIVGGIEALPHEFPFQLSLQYIWENKRNHYCGASLINENWIVTAAHCVYEIDPELVTIVAGEHQLQNAEGNEQFRKVTKVIIHSEYNWPDAVNDIALLRLDAPLTLNTTSVGTISIPSSGYEASGKTNVFVMVF
ncbi:unnamed protein product [Allacma fusca]|uniref:Peptidase S1 domain-containing protein n=1 Tax=Allacma fusca TaxID=39272 RepID=A0A8J2PR22_9HEXA|nr:unnamed protein product [Allacma fusca]